MKIGERDKLGRRFNIKPKDCAVCGTRFQPESGFQKYCSLPCRVEGEKVERVCPKCGETFKRARSARITYCSPACANAANVRRRVAGRGLQMLGTGVCRVCKQKFEKRSRKAEYCSKSCAMTGRHQRRRETLQSLPPWSVKSKGERHCRACGRMASHLHHIVPRSKTKAGHRDLRNGLPLCFDCHRGWHDRRVTIPLTCLRRDELLLAVELANPVWVERNYPIPTTFEQAELLRVYGSLDMAWEAMASKLGPEFMDISKDPLPQGETLIRFIKAIESSQYRKAA